VKHVPVGRYKKLHRIAVNSHNTCVRLGFHNVFVRCLAILPWYIAIVWTRKDSSESQPQKKKTVTITPQHRPEPLPAQRTRSRKPSGMVPEDPSSIPYRSNDGERERPVVGDILEAQGGASTQDSEVEECDSPSEDSAPPMSDK
jgi:hypothetical protein